MIHAVSTYCGHQRIFVNSACLPAGCDGCSCRAPDEVMDQDEMEDLLDDLGIDADY